MTYTEATQIAHKMATSTSKAAQLLRAKMRATNHQATFIIMRFGDPRNWKKLPKGRDTRTKNPKVVKMPFVFACTDEEAIKFVDETKRSGGEPLRLLKLKSDDYRRRCNPYRYPYDYISIVRKFGDPRTWDGLPVATKGRTTRRPLTLEHAQTGRVISAPGITTFCRLANLTGSAQFHITPILDGKRVHHKGWYLPSFLDQQLNLRDIYGNLYSMTVREWIRDHKRSGQTANRLLTGGKKSIVEGRVMLASTVINSPIAPNPIRTTEVKLTDGKRVFSGRTISEAARNAGFKKSSNLYKVAYGFKDEAWGLRVKSIEIEKKRALAEIV